MAGDVTYNCIPHRRNNVAMKQYLANTRIFFSTIACSMHRSASRLQWAKRLQVGRIPNIMTTSHQSPSPQAAVCFRGSYCGKWAGLNMKQEEMFIIAATFSLMQHCFRCREREGVFFFFSLIHAIFILQISRVSCMLSTVNKLIE